LEVSGIAAGSVFHSIDRHGRIGAITAQVVALVVKRWVQSRWTWYFAFSDLCEECESATTRRCERCKRRCNENRPKLSSAAALYSVR
jgi:hypothetical protein